MSSWLSKIRSVHTYHNVCYAPDGLFWLNLYLPDPDSSSSQMRHSSPEPEPEPSMKERNKSCFMEMSQNTLESVFPIIESNLDY